VLGLRRTRPSSYGAQSTRVGLALSSVAGSGSEALTASAPDLDEPWTGLHDLSRAAEAPAIVVDEVRAPEVRVPAPRSLATTAVADFVILAAALTVAAVLARLEAHEVDLRWVLFFAGFFLLFDRLPKSRNRLRLDVLNLTRDLVFVTTLAAITLLAVRVLATDNPAAAAQTLTVWVTATALLIPARVAQTKFERRARRAGAATRNTLIVGAGRVGHLVANRLLAQPEFGLRPIGFLDKTPLNIERHSAPLPILGASWDLEEVLHRHGVQHVIFTFSTAPHHVLLRMVSRCHELGIDVSLVPRLFEKMTGRIQVDHLGGLPLLSVRQTDPSGWQFRLKYASDRVIAAVTLVLLSPILLACAVAVYLSLGRPILFRQRRIGLNGHEFEMLKFRSMHISDDESLPELEQDTAPGGCASDERQTRVGRFMRRASLDELPQFVNVVRGDMSLVGPRPERPEFARIFLQDVHRYGERLRVKSGITGWAQVHGLRGNTSLKDRVEWDNYYIENWSPWLDFKILLLTVRDVLRFAGE